MVLVHWPRFQVICLENKLPKSSVYETHSLMQTSTELVYEFVHSLKYELTVLMNRERFKRNQFWWALMCSQACANVVGCLFICFFVCENEKKVRDEWQTRQATHVQAIRVSRSEHNANKNTATARSMPHKTITAILTAKEKQSTNQHMSQSTCVGT